ncbi:patatin-like phospholipase family protein [Rhodocyclus purpureus]|uniref:patatin-like phospholipase family protein n=1 Tax=Rhodocyclus purpureus TaxID=1067 RepID=UPI001912310E|nr:patatin-like phospholipase family protein [Rhodocyclus purpureus]MBK5912779.1 patatin [Rhodocyclus purpureus]
MNGRSRICRLGLAALLLIASLAQASEATRPRIGLVLGGGGARGAAHIGVLEVLERLRVPVDCIAGTSMGALVSGAYAAGLSPAEMRSELAKADWNDMFQDNPPYSEINYRNKEISTRFMPGSETGVGEKGVAYQRGVVSGQKIKLFFNRLVGSDLGERSIESLPLPLSIIATDIGNGEKVVFRDGSLTKAMRASMSVPGMMAPVEHQGHKLVDGGLVDNLPIAEARARCRADIVIAVNVGSPLLKADEVGSLLTVSMQMVNILTEQNVTHSLASLQAGDIYIKPDLEGISAGDFSRTSETADRGRVAAEVIADRLKAFSVSEERYAAWSQKLAYSRQTAPGIDEIQVAGLKTINPAALERHLRVRPGDRIDAARLNQDMLRAYGDGWYESIDYSLLSERDRHILRVLPVEKSWGPDYMRFGVSLYSDFKQDSSFTLRAAHHKTWLNTFGGELLAAAEIGRRNAVGVDLYQPLDPRQRYFVEASASYARENFGVYQDDEKFAEYAKTQRNVSVGAGVNVGLLGQLRVGWRQRWVEAKLDTGLPTAAYPETTNKSWGGVYAGIDLDQMNRLYFPTEGWSSRLGYFNSSGAGYSKLLAEVKAAESFGDYVLNGRLGYQGSARGSLPVHDAATLGGLNNLAGFALNQLIGDDIRYAGLRLEKIIGRLPLGLRGDLRAGIALETGKVGQPLTETRLSGWMNSLSIYLGGETPLGPVYLGYGRSDTGASSLYLFLGTP